MIVGKCIRCTIKAWCLRKAIPIREFSRRAVCRRAVGKRGLDRRRGFDFKGGFDFRGGFDFTVYYYSY
jgi:hypothetical protein